MTDKKTIAALNQVTEQLARIAAAVEGGTTYTPRHAAPTLTPTYAIDDPTGGDTWGSLDDALAEISTWDESARREALDAGFVVKWRTAWLPVEEHVTPPDDEVVDADVVDSPKVWTVEELEELPVGWTVHDMDGDAWTKTDRTVDGYAAWRLSSGRGEIIGSQRLLCWVNPEPDVERGAPDRQLRVWTFEDLEALPIGWTVRDRDGDPWEKAGYRGDGTSMWRPGDSDSLPRSSEALMRWMNPVNVAGMTVEELRAADNGTRVVDSLNDTWRKEGDEFVHVQWPSASPVTAKTLHQYGPILEATV